jgi:hypothetical protein
MAPDPTPNPALRGEGGLWRVDLICCGREDAHIVRGTWAEADEFRRSYEHTADSDWPHDRAGILVRDYAHTLPCNGYANDCPLPGGSFLEVSCD